MRFLEMANIVEGFVIVDTQTAANAGDWVSLANYKRCAVVFASAVGVAGDDPILALQQATTVAGGSVKDLTFTHIYRKQAAVSLAAVGTWTETVQAAAASYTNATSAEQDLIWVVDIDADTLDVDNGFDCIAANVADTGAAGAQLGYLFYILYEPRYPTAPANMLSAIV